MLRTRIQSEYLHNTTGKYSGIIQGIKKIYKEVSIKLRNHELSYSNRKDSWHYIKD